MHHDLMIGGHACCLVNLTQFSGGFEAFEVIIGNVVHPFDIEDPGMSPPR